MDDIIHIKLLGTDLSIRAGKNGDYIKRVVQFYQKKMAETRERSPLQDPLKISILTSFNIIDELFKSESNRGQEPLSYSTIEDMGERADDLIDLINRALDCNEEN